MNLLHTLPTTVLIICTMLLAPCFPTWAQHGKKIPIIGFLSSNAPPTNRVQDGSFERGLRDLGYVDSKNLIIEYRYAEGKIDRYPQLIAELIQLKSDVLVISALPAIRAAKQASKTIPIVMVTAQDPVATGLIESLGRPGGNITGVTLLTRELSGKRLELLSELTPTGSRLGILWYPQGESSTIGFKEYEAAALSVKIPLHSLELRLPNPDLNETFRAAAKARVSGLVTIIVPPVFRYQDQIISLTIKHRLPSIWERTEFVEAGALASYAPSEDPWRRSAVYGCQTF